MRSENMEAQPWLRSCDFQLRWEWIRRYESQRRSPSHKELPSDVDQTTDMLDLATRRVSITTMLLPMCTGATGSPPNGSEQCAVKPSRV
jgi:hypothetical protein